MKKILHRLTKSPAALIALGFVALGLLGLALYVSNERTAARQHAATDQHSLMVPAASADDHMLGNISAPVQVIVYDDLSCPYCANFFHVHAYRLQQEFGKKIVIILRHLPLQIHPRAKAEAEAAECVGMVGSETDFWAFVKGVYSNKDYETGLSDAQMRSIVAELPIDASKYNSCVSNRASESRVLSDLVQAQTAGLTVTPSFVLKSDSRALTVSGDSYARLESGINYLLAASSSSD